MKAVAVAILFSLLALLEARAVLTYNGTAANLVAPVDDPGWLSVASISGPGDNPATAIFLGNSGGYGWFLTASHVGLTNATLTINGTNFTAFAGQTSNATADLKVFRVDTLVTGVAPVSLASSTPSAGSPVTMIGHGRTGNFTTWTIPGGNATWTSPGTDASGYDWATPNVMRWGTNAIHQKDIALSTVSFITDFDAVDGEAQGSRGDSGGAVFFKNGLDWELVGMIYGVGTIGPSSAFIGQPNNTSVSSITSSPGSKSVTFSAQIANYNGWIQTATGIPEPSTAGLVVAGAAFWAMQRRRRAKDKQVP